MDAPVRVAVVGAGSISREFALNHFGQHTSTKVTAIVDTDAGKAQRLAIEVGSLHAGGKLGLTGTRLYTSTVADRLGTPVAHATSLSKVLHECDVVYIGTTPSSHASLVLGALAAKKSILLEKPIAASREDSDAIVVAAEVALTQGIYLGMNIGMRWNRALTTLRQLAVEDTTGQTIGKLKKGKLCLHFREWPREWQVQPWVGQRAQGGALREVGSHFLFGLHELFGHESITRVRTTVEYPDGAAGVRAECEATGEIEINNDFIVDLSVLTTQKNADSDVYDLTIEGETGTLQLFAFTSLHHISSAGVEKVLVDGATYGRTDSVTSLVSSVKTGTNTGLVTARHGRNTQRTLDAILSSNGEWTTVVYN